MFQCPSANRYGLDSDMLVFSRGWLNAGGDEVNGRRMVTAAHAFDIF